VYVSRYRWATFRQNIVDISVSAKAVAAGDEGFKLWQHIGGAHYVSVTSGYRCVDFRMWYQPYGSKDGDIKSTKRGVALRFDEWSHLCTLVDTINTAYPSLASALPCYYDDDHMNQMGWLNCSECHPFTDNLSQTKRCRPTPTYQSSSLSMSAVSSITVGCVHRPLLRHAR